MRVLLEVCIASVEDALAAAAGGADRLELNAALSLGGLTPSLGMLQEVRQAAPLPLVVMLRPRAGGFCYSRREFAVMRRDLDAALECGASGLAFGILREDGLLDAPRCRVLIEQAAGREAVFHRAFDFLLNAEAALAELAALGVRRIMTSGGQPTALSGAERIAELIRHAPDTLEVLPAGKIDAASARELLSRTGCRQVHAALRATLCDSPGHPLGYLAANEPAAFAVYEAVSPQAVRDLRATLDAFSSGE